MIKATIECRGAAALLLGALFFCLLPGCGRSSQTASTAGKSAADSPAGEPAVPAAAPAPDPRSAFDTDGLLGGSAAFPEQGFEPLSASQGRPQCAAFSPEGALLASGDSAGDSALALIRDGGEGGRVGTRLKAPVLLLIALHGGKGSCASLCADGRLSGFDASLKELWHRAESPAGAALAALPQDRLAFACAAGDGGSISVINAADGSGAAELPLKSASRGIAYAAGFVLSLENKSLVIYDENDLREAGRCELDSPGRSVAASANGQGGELAAVLEDSGRIESFSLPDMHRMSISASSFDRTLPVAVDRTRAFAARKPAADRPGALVEIDLVSGAAAATYEFAPGDAGSASMGSLNGPLMAFAVDSSSVYALSGARLCIAPRHSASAPAGAGAKDGASRSCLLPELPASGLGVLGGRLCFIGKSGVFYAARSEGSGAGLNEVLAPSAAQSEAMLSMLDKYRAREPGESYLDYDLFVDGLSIDPGRAAFTACRFKAEQSGLGRFVIARASEGTRILLALFSDQGALVDSNFDDYGLSPVFAVPLEKGREYWLVTGRLDDSKDIYCIDLDWKTGQ